MKNLRTILLLIFLAGLNLLVFTACDDDDEDEMPGFDIQLDENDELGSYLTDEEGNTLYYFSRDVDGNSACSGGCLSAWPVFHVENPTLGPGLDAADFDAIDRGDGTMQTTYKGWPLYYFAQDNSAGDVNGEAVNNVWWVAKPDYTLMIGSKVLMEGGSAENYLVDAEGNTLYMFTPDPAGESVCTGNCINNWPAFLTTTEVVLPSTLNMTDLAMINRPDAGQQHTYQDMPLYYFVNDADRGDTNGEGVNNVWFVVNP
jgi:predicted lipoprotein with Yx(FWY)xxD motif